MMNLRTINADDVLIIYVTFFNMDGGKKRPVLVVNVIGKTILFYSMTSQYEKKSKKIQQQYYPLKNWNELGLIKPTYIDTGSLKKILVDSPNRITKVGELTLEDINGLREFIQNRFK